jgi:cell division protein FtsI/penicillin-binding protein 2
VRRRTGRRSTSAAVAVAVLLLLVGACTSGPDPAAAARTLAAGLASGTLTSIEWAAGSPAVAELTATRTAAFAGLGEKVTPTVRAQVGKRTGDTAPVTLAWTWVLGTPGISWTYRTTTTLSLTDGAWRVAWSPALLAPDLTAGETLAAKRLTATRGQVLGAGGAAIVEPRPVVHVGIDKTRVDAAGVDGAARALAGAVGLDSAAYASKVAAAGPKAFVEAIVLRVPDPDYDLAALRAMPGVLLVDGQLPLAPTRTFARGVLGTVGDATAEIVAQSGGTVVAGDLVGLSGLEKQYDEQLRGRPGVDVIATSADGATRRQLFHADPVAGTAVQTTVDPDLESAAEQLLAGQSSASAIVAIRPSTGDVLTVASGPGGGGTSTATLGQYAPGSSFKIVSALALLRAGLTPTSTVQCPTSVTVDGKQFANVPDYPRSKLGPISLTTALAHSCNTVFVGGAEQVDNKALASAARSLGLDSQARPNFAAFLGAVPDGASGTDHAASMIGQGKVLASPLGMATVMASVVAGATVLPRLVVPAAAGPATASSSATATGTPSASAEPVQPLTAAEASALTTMLRAAVTEGTATVLSTVPGGPVIAKTGTAQYATTDGSLANHAWMVAAQGDLAVAVFVETGDFGATTAGPIMAQFLAAAAGH